jgi:hypothetical protein
MHGRNREKEGNLKLECDWCAHCIRANIVILNWQRPLWESDQEVVKRSGKDEPMWVVIHLCMETMLGISLYSYLYLKLAKMLCLSYCILCFLFNKIGEQGGRTGSAWKWAGVGVGGRGRWPQTMHTLMDKCKNNKKVKWNMNIFCQCMYNDIM